MNAMKKVVWPKILVQYAMPDRPREIITLEAAIKRFGLDEREAGWLERGEVVGTGVKEPHVSMINRYTLDDSIRDAAKDLLEALKEVVSILPANQDKLMKLGLDAWIYDAKAAIKKAEMGDAL